MNLNGIMIFKILFICETFLLINLQLCLHHWQWLWSESVQGHCCLGDLQRAGSEQILGHSGYDWWWFPPDWCYSCWGFHCHMHEHAAVNKRKWKIIKFFLFFLLLHSSLDLWSKKKWVCIHNKWLRTDWTETVLW